MHPGENTLEHNYQRKLLSINKSMNNHLIWTMKSTFRLLLIEILDKYLSQNKIFSARGLILIYSKHINIWALASIINKLAPLIWVSVLKFVAKYRMSRPRVLDPALIFLAHGIFPTASWLGYLWLHRQMIVFRSPVDSCSELRVLIRSSDKKNPVFCSSTLLFSLVKSHWLTICI